MSKEAIIYPGATIGVLGSGQLGRMLAIAARRLGYRVHTYSPYTDTPTGQVADVEVVGSYEDLDAVRQFASKVSTVTFEFENVPYAAAQAAAERAPVRPGGSVLHTTQDRLRERAFLVKSKLPHAPFVAVNSPEELKTGLEKIGAPAILKTSGFGYDGKGQWRIDATSELDEVWKSAEGNPLMLESRIDFAHELSVIGVRGIDGTFVHYGPILNMHKSGILDISVASPANLPASLQSEAVEMTRFVMEELDVVGVLCVEMFLNQDGSILINEIAPRPHNSGHYSIDACITDQFEQQLRAVCGLPLGSAEMIWPAAAMANLLGDLWSARSGPHWLSCLKAPTVKLHLYGKTEARIGRKMGHITVLSDSPDEAERIARSMRASLLIDIPPSPEELEPEIRLMNP